VSWIGTISVAGPLKPIDCIVRDVSSSGALLVLQTTEGIPRSFRLHIVGSTRERACEVRRRTARMLGVQFTD
jgi:hypothetical protein